MAASAEAVVTGTTNATMLQGETAESATAAKVTAAVSTTDDRKVTAEDTATQMLKEAFRQEAEFRQRTEAELDNLTQILWAQLHGSIHNTPGDLLRVKKRTLKQLSLDLELLDTLNQKLKSYSISQVSFPLKFNKMRFALKGACAFVETHFDTICSGKLPEGYDFHSKPSDTTVLGVNKTSIYGDPKATILKTALWNIALNYFGITHLALADLDRESGLYSRSKGSWYTNSSMVYSTALPKDLDLLALDPRFANFTYIKDGLFTFLHSGFTFGGQRKEEGTEHAHGLFGPEDCASWLAKITKCPVPFTTPDQLLYWRFKVKEGVVSEAWLKAPEFGPLNDLFDVVKVDPDNISAIKPGQIYCHRAYPVDLGKDPKLEDVSARMLKEFGNGGHTALIVDVKGSGRDASVRTLGYGRELDESKEDKEGFGLYDFQLFPPPITVFEKTAEKTIEKTVCWKVMVFSLKAKTVAGTAGSTTAANGQGATATVGATAATVAASEGAAAAQPELQRPQNHHGAKRNFGK